MSITARCRSPNFRGSDMSIRPDTIEDVCAAVAEAVRSGHRLEIRGGGSKALIGAPRDAVLLDMRGFAGIVDYDPAELVLTVGAGTRLADIEALIGAEGQVLAFDPFDHGPLFGAATGCATIGGVVSAGVAGSCRISAGGARDHLLGFRGVSGRGEAFVAGARVVKNVTGYDLPKLLAGSWGRLAAITELTLKVLPRPRTVVTMLAEGLDDRAAIALMARALGSYADVSAAAHLPAWGDSSQASTTLLRVAGFPRSVEARCEQLPAIVCELAELRRANADEAERLWHDVRYAIPLDGPTLWRVHLPASRACHFLAKMAPLNARWLLDWGGALIWLACEEPPAAIRAAAAECSGQAALVRAPSHLWETVPAQHPRSAGIGALESRVRRAFDPNGVFETGRFLGEFDAD